ncbi:MAG: glutamate 5-kinase [Promethearchaeota archaeon]
MRIFPSNNNTIVIKVSTQLITDGKAQIYEERIKKLVREVANLVHEGRSIILVSSGAIGCGLAKLGLEKRPKDFKKLQALAAVGQITLMSMYQKEFNKYELEIGQILLTADDTKDATRRSNVRNTIEVLLEKNIVPIINENDSVAIEELRHGDNDTLSALVATLLYVDLLVILTDVDGLCDKNPKKDPNSNVISNISEISHEIEKLVDDIDSGITFGGMRSKINAIKKLTNIGIPAIISSFKEDNTLKKILKGEEIGTYFNAQT